MLQANGEKTFFFAACLYFAFMAWCTRHILWLLVMNLMWMGWFVALALDQTIREEVRPDWKGVDKW